MNCGPPLSMQLGSFAVAAQNQLVCGLYGPLPPFPFRLIPEEFYLSTCQMGLQYSPSHISDHRHPCTNANCKNSQRICVTITDVSRLISQN